MTVNCHPERRKDLTRTAAFSFSEPLASPQRVIPNEVRDLAYEVHVPSDSQCNAIIL
jgi:hypothetical protein